MRYQGFVKDGVVVLDGAVCLPEGARVEVLLAVDDAEESGATFYERLKPVFGVANDLPVDGSRNLDFYLYGADAV